jgi:RNA polymerase sigma factor (sigma-70 family)
VLFCGKKNHINLNPVFMEDQTLIPKLFRTEFTKITSVLCKYLGIENIEAAEDIVSDTFLLALETWPYKGLPENPTAWLYMVAKNKTKNYLKRSNIFSENVAPNIQSATDENPEPEIDLSGKNITDSQLQMLFAICHPSISKESQIGLALRILCGLGIDEIANALLTGKETINKRLFRAREKLRTEKVKIEFPSGSEISGRIDTVLMTLYLLFNEGYYSESQDSVLREDLCLEAMRLTRLLTDNTETDLPEANALLSLMCFHSSRFEARKNITGEIILYDDQDEKLWNTELIARGVWYLHKATSGKNISKYHLEAGIAYWHTKKTDSKEKWENILHLYNQLLITDYSAVAALNRVYAVSKINGKKAAINEAESLQLVRNHYYYALLGELYRGIDNEKSRHNFGKALTLAKTKGDKSIIQKNIDKLKKKPGITT